MVQVIPFLLVLCLTLVAPGFSAGKCQPTGYWINKQSHILIVQPVDQGSFSGYYLKNQSYPLKGLQLLPSQNRQITLGFVVNYSSGSIRVFTGQCFMENTGKEVLKTIWLELSLVGNIEYYWTPTRVGTDEFTRLLWWKEDGITGDLKTGESAWDAEPISCSTSCF